LILKPKSKIRSPL